MKYSRQFWSHPSTAIAAGPTGCGKTNDAFDVKYQLIVLDDLMNESKDNQEIMDIFTKKSHHRNISIILITQNIFSRGSCIRVIK